MSQPYYTSEQYALKKYVESGTTIIIGAGKEYEITARNGGSSNIAFSSRVQYYFNNISNAFTNSVDLQITMSALATTGSPTSPRFTNALACFLFRKMRFLCNGAMVGNEVDPQVIRAWIMAVCPQDEWGIVSAQLGIDTTANRATAASAVSQYVLPMHWIFRYLQQFPLFMISSNVYCVEFDLQPALPSIIEYTGGTTPTFSATINQIVMRVSTDASAAVAAYWAEVFSTGKQVAMYGLKKGILFEGNDYLTKQYSVASGTTSTSLTVPELQDKLVKAVIMTAHTTSDLAGTGGVANYDNYLNVVSSWNIKSGSSYVDETDNFPITRLMIVRDYARKHIPGCNQLQSSNLILRSFSNSLDQDAFDEGTPGFDGAYSYMGIQNCQIDVTFSSALAANTTIFFHIIYARRDVLREDGLLHDLSTQIRAVSY